MFDRFKEKSDENSSMLYENFDKQIEELVYIKSNTLCLSEDIKVLKE